MGWAYAAVQWPNGLFGSCPVLLSLQADKLLESLKQHCKGTKEESENTVTDKKLAIAFKKCKP